MGGAAACRRAGAGPHSVQSFIQFNDGGDGPSLWPHTPPSHPSGTVVLTCFRLVRLHARVRRRCASSDAALVVHPRFAAVLACVQCGASDLQAPQHCDSNGKVLLRVRVFPRLRVVNDRPFLPV